MKISISHARLGELAESLFMGVNFGRVDKDETAPSYDSVPVIHVKDVANGDITHVDLLQRVNRSKVPQSDRQSLHPGDLLVSARGTLLKCAVISSSHAGAVASANFIIVRFPQNPKLQPELLSAFLDQPMVRAHIEKNAGSSVQPALKIRELEELKVPVPPLDIQSELVRFLGIAREQHRCAIESAQLRLEEAMDIVAHHMGIEND